MIETIITLVIITTPVIILALRYKIKIRVKIRRDKGKISK